MNEHVTGEADSVDGARPQSASSVTSRTEDNPMSADSTDKPYCITTCKLGRSGAGDMVRCCMCFHWYHEDCVKSDKSRDAHWWLCLSCRGMSQRLILLETSISTLTNTVQELATVNTELSNNNERLVAEIRKLNSEQKARYEARDNTVFKCKAPSPSKPDLLIGSSIIRDLVSNDDKSLVIKSHGGARTDNILKIMNNMKTDEYGDVFLQVGSNDSATKKPVQGIVENFDKLIATAKRVSSTGHVTLSSICPRTDDDEAAARGIDINSRVQELADTRGCVLIEHEGTFLCKNGEINTALLLIDGLHLSEAGSKALLHNLGLAARAHVRLGRGMRGKGPPKTRDTSHHEHQRDRVSPDSNGGRRPPSSRPSQRDRRPYIPRNQWVSGQSDRRRFGDQRQPQHQPFDGERHGRIEWHHHRTFHTSNPHSDESRRRDDMNQPERRRRQPRCWYCYEPGHTYQQCRHKDYVQCGNCGQLGHKSKHCNTESHEY